MDGRQLPILTSALCGPIAVDTAPTDCVHESSSVTYSGSAQQVSEGFAVALRAMGFEAGILPPDIAQSDATPNPEDSS
jgi:hypothetical protein